MSILTCGPFLGDFEQEITCFRPYIQYISTVEVFKKIIIASHHNRKFLYDNFYNVEFYPVYENLSRDEDKQVGYIHMDVSQKDFNLFSKRLKEAVIKKENVSVRNISLHNISYIKSTTPYSIYQKEFRPILIPEQEIEEKDFVLFIPDKKINTETAEEIYDFLTKEYNVIVGGDLKCHLPDKNIVTKAIDYFENGYKYLLSYIEKASFVVTPCSHWTFLCNLQKTPVFSWGSNPSIYKMDGIYGFGNTNVVIPSDEDTDLKIILDGIKYLEEQL